jgi:fatty-acyl-CoA synthase
MQDAPLCVGSIVKFCLSTFGDAEVVTATDGNSVRRRAFSEMGERASRLAAGLRALGVAPLDRVATFMWNNVEHLEAYIAVPSMGSVLHTLNIRLFPQQIVYIANHAEDRVIIVDTSLIPVLAGVVNDLQTVHTVLVAGEGDLTRLSDSGKTILRYEDVIAGAHPIADWPVSVDERSAAAMCYTSGTTGDPKGVVYSHRSCWLHTMSLLTANSNGGLSWNDRAMPVVPMFHANAWGSPYAALAAGADLIMPDRFLSAESLVRLIENEKVTVSQGVPTIWNDILQYLRANPGHDISSLRAVLCGGSAVPRSLIEGFEREFGVPIVQAWGMTETSPVAAVASPPRAATSESSIDYRSMTGRPLLGVESRLVGDDGAPCPHDGTSVGELEVRGPWVTAAYYKDADANRFHDGWLRTGDIGTIDRLGYIRLSDRAKDVIKSGGEWISSVDLEGHLMAHPDVLEASVVGVPDAKWEERPLAVVVVKAGAAVTVDALLEHLRQRVPRWWLPERWTFVDAVPKTSVGKFDKKTIRRGYAEGAYDVAHILPAPGAPRSR